MKAGEQSKIWYAANKEYHKARSKAYYHSHKADPAFKAKIREKGKKEWAKRVAVQESVAGRSKPDACEVCGRDGGYYGIAFDHNHQTGEFRGWLCSHCNRALGFLNDDPALLRKLADYLES